MTRPTLDDLRRPAAANEPRPLDEPVELMCPRCRRILTCRYHGDNVCGHCLEHHRVHVDLRPPLTLVATDDRT